MGQLDGKVAIVTGAAVGMGREIAITFARQGAGVTINYSKSAKEAEKTADLVRQAGGEPLLFQADVSDAARVQAMVAATLGRFGRIDVLVNNAGITSRLPFDDLDALTDELWDRLYAVNVKGVFFCCRAVAGPMKAQGSGRIINLASVAGLRPTGSSIAYCASKAAVVQVSQCLAKVLAPQVRVNVIAPGFIDETRWNEGVADLDGLRQRAIGNTPLRRVGTPADVAEAALFLATGADFMTGATLVIDGGRQFYQ